MKRTSLRCCGSSSKTQKPTTTKNNAFDFGRGSPDRCPRTDPCAPEPLKAATHPGAPGRPRVPRSGPVPAYGTNTGPEGLCVSLECAEDVFALPPRTVLESVAISAQA